MSKSTSNVVAFAAPPVEKDALTELIRQGAQQLLSQAIEIELEERMAELQERRLTDGRQGVVRNGYHPERQVQTGIGPVTVQVPKIRARDGKPVVFRSALVPPYVREPIAGSCTALVVPKGRVFRGNVRGTGCAGWTRGIGSVS